MPEPSRGGGREALVVAVTGGIGAGKTSFCDALASLPGVRVLDADAAAHRSLAEDAAVGRAVRDRFGPGILDAWGAIDRARLAEIVFRDAGARRDLEAIVHPAVQRELAREVDRLRRTEGVAIVLVQIPLLAEIGVPAWCDRVVTVETGAGVRRERARAADRDPQEIDRRLAVQATEADRRAIADEVVINDGDRSSLTRAARGLFETWRCLQEGGER
jgi:dephospho-CoA kinase